MSGSRPGRAASLLLAALAGWGAARLPAAVAELGSLRDALAAPAQGLSAPAPGASAPPATASVEAAPAAPAPVAPLAWPGLMMGWPMIIERTVPVWLAAPAAPAQPQAAETLPALPWPQPAEGRMAEQVAPPPPAEAGELAEAAYARLREGDRRGASRLFAAALAADPEMRDPRAGRWLMDARALARRWSGEGWMLLRAGTGDLAPGVPAAPVLGGGQAGATLAFAPDPLARRPLSVLARFNAGTDAAGQLDPRTGQAAIGVQWRPVPGLALAAERLVATGELARDDWLLRVSGGGRQRLAAGVPLTLDGYGEASLIGNGDWLAGAQGRALTGLLARGGIEASAGLGGWGSVQSVGGQSLGRLDVGPSATLRTGLGRLNLEASVDYRQRVAGQAEPGSGPVLTVSTAF